MKNEQVNTLRELVSSGTQIEWSLKKHRRYLQKLYFNRNIPYNENKEYFRKRLRVLV